MNIMDPIADLLIRIKNGLAVQKREVVAPHSKMKESLARLLVSAGFLENLEVVEEGKDPEGFARKSLKLVLKYDQQGMPAISGLVRVSKPGQRIYSKSDQIPKVPYGMGATIVSTSRGLMTDRQAKKEKVGGEVICQIW